MIDIDNIAPDQIKTDMPDFNPGDHIRVQRLKRAHCRQVPAGGGRIRREFRRSLGR